jgi:hypothetical protein
MIPPDDESADWGFATGDGGLSDPFECLFTLGMASEVGRCTVLALGAVSSVIEVGTDLAGVGTLLEGVSVGAKLTGCSLDPLGHAFA